MGYFGKRDEEEKKNRFLDILEMAFADGEISDIETKVIDVIIKNIGLTQEEIDEIAKNPNAVKPTYPKTREDKAYYFVDLIAVMIADGKMAEGQMEFCKVMAKKLGFNPYLIDDVAEILDKLEIDEITQEEFDEELSKILEF